jgi:hypothetical protein
VSGNPYYSSPPPWRRLRRAALKRNGGLHGSRLLCAGADRRSHRLRAILDMMRRLDLTDNERAVLITTLRRLVDFHQVVSFKSPADTPAMPGMLRKSTAFVPRYQKFESISLQQRVGRTFGS